jgi:hypothetical protein
MGTPIEDDETREPVPMVLPLDRGTLAWLTTLSHGSDAAAAEIIASMLHDIRIDDEKMHSTHH